MMSSRGTPFASIEAAVEVGRIFTRDTFGVGKVLTPLKVTRLITILLGWILLAFLIRNYIPKMKKIGLIPADTNVSESEYQDWDSLPDEEKMKEAKRMAIYAAMIDSIDQNIGKLLAQVEELGQLDNTLILFAADNGACAENVENAISKKFKGEMGTVGYYACLGKDWANVCNTPFKKAKNSSYEGGEATPLVDNRFARAFRQSGDGCHVRL